MRHGRSKQARRTLQLLERTAGFTVPYNLLLDGTFAVAVVKYKLPLLDRLDRILQNKQYTLLMLPSSFDELEKIAKSCKGENHELVQEALSWARQHCEVVHLETNGEDSSSSARHSEELSKLGQASREIYSMIDSGPYFCLSQDEELLDLVRRRPKPTPVLRLARGSVLLLEQISKVAQNWVTSQERTKWSVKGSVNQQERVLVDIVKDKERADRSHDPQKTRQRTTRRPKKAKGPNPLSCKKKRPGETSNGGKKRQKR